MNYALRSFHYFYLDLPSVISNEKLSYIDPHEKFFVEDGKNVTGFTWHLKDDYKVSIITDPVLQLLPFF